MSSRRKQGGCGSREPFRARAPRSSFTPGRLELELEITEQQFSARPNVALAGSFYTDTHCTVGNDGSLWCRSSNHRGELGSNPVSPYTDTEIRPPGTVKVTCN